MQKRTINDAIWNAEDRKHGRSHERRALENFQTRFFKIESYAWILSRLWIFLRSSGRPHQTIRADEVVGHLGCFMAEARGGSGGGLGEPELIGPKRILCFHLTTTAPPPYAYTPPSSPPKQNATNTTGGRGGGVIFNNFNCWLLNVVLAFLVVVVFLLSARPTSTCVTMTPLMIK